jgi:hypothetical protein
MRKPTTRRAWHAISKSGQRFLRSTARQYIDLAHDLVGELLTLRRIMR